MPPRIELLPENGKYYKANLHCHTTLSDGTWTPEETKDRYMAQGYSVVAFTDHNKYIPHPELCSDEFIALPSFEADINCATDIKRLGGRRTRTWHLNFYATRDNLTEADIPPRPTEYDVDGINAYISQMRKNGFLCCYNHPYWSLQTTADYTALRGLWAMEIYNYGCDVGSLYGYAPQVYDEMLRVGQRLACVDTDDNHDEFVEGHPGNDSFGGFTMLCCEEFSHAGVIDAMRNKRFYSSMGPTINAVWLEGDVLTVRSSPVQKICLSSDGRDRQYVFAPAGQSIEQASFTLTGKEDYIRLTLKDGEGKFANTNAWFPDELGR